MGLFKKVFGKKGLFDKIGRGIDKVTGGLGSKVFKTVKKAALPIAGGLLAPVTGGTSLLVAGVAQKALKAIGDAKASKIVEAVVRDGEVKVDKIDQTLKKVGVSVGKDVANHIGNSVAAVVKEETGSTPVITPASSMVDNTPNIDYNGNFNQNFTQKVKEYSLKVWEFVKKHKVWAIAIAAGAVLLFFVKPFSKGGRRKKWRV